MITILLQLKYELNVMMILIVELPRFAIKVTAWMLADKRDAEITLNASIQFMTPDVSAFQATLVIHSASASHVSICQFSKKMVNFLACTKKPSKCLRM